MQKKWESLVVSYVMTWAIYRYVIPFLFHVNLSNKQAVGFILVFTISSAIRHYTVRRLFNAIESRKK